MDIQLIRQAYDLVATEYGRRIGGELDGKPFDRRWLADFVRLSADRRQLRVAAQPDQPPGKILEAGCGDGHIVAFLEPLARDAGLGVLGADLSPAMVEIAQQTFGTLQFHVDNMLASSLPESSLDGLVSFYSIVNLDLAACAQALREFSRVLIPGGVLTLATHVGQEVIRQENWWETGACIDFYLHPAATLCRLIEENGLQIVRCEQREPYPPAVESQTQRLYVMAIAERGLEP